MHPIRALREKTGLTQVAFGKLLGIPRRTIQNWENGVRKVPPYVVALIAFRLQYYTPEEANEDDASGTEPG